MCGTIDPGHTYDEHLVLVLKPGVTFRTIETFVESAFATVSELSAIADRFFCFGEDS